MRLGKNKKLKTMPPVKLPYPGDQYIKDMIAKEGYFKKDANGNTIIANGVTIVDSVGNFITADNAVVTKSHNNILNAKNVIIENASGCRADGADHTIKFGANYCSVDGDANWIEGYGSRTSGFGNINCGEHSSIDGNTNRIGLKGQPNKCRDCSIRGNNCEIDGGSNNHAIGSFIRINGSGITVIGNNIAGIIFTTPGVHIIN